MRRRQIKRLPLAIGTLVILAAAVVAGGAALWLTGVPSSRGSVRQSLEPACSRKSPCLALVMDDVGRDLNALRSLLKTGLDISYSVLPHARHTGESLNLLRQARREVMLHLPMAPIDRQQITDEQVVLEKEPLKQALQSCIEKVPGAVGINNHMGSAFTRQPALVKELLAALPRHLWLVDSRTTADSVLCRNALEQGFRCLERDVFLDASLQPVAMRLRLQQALARAENRGYAVAIAHPHPRTVALLQELGKRQGQSVRIRKLSTVLPPLATLRRQARGEP